MLYILCAEVPGLQTPKPSISGNPITHNSNFYEVMGQILEYHGTKINKYYTGKSL
jgi:hypothetical protein